MTFRQAQTTGLFDMPVQIVLRTGDSRQERKVRISQQDQKLRIELPARPSGLEIDPDGWVLKSVKLTEQP
jgi:hypothetical protein